MVSVRPHSRLLCYSFPGTTYGQFEGAQCSCPARGRAISDADLQRCVASNDLGAADGLGGRPVCAHEIRTPKVVEKAREFFACPTLTGEVFFVSEFFACPTLTGEVFV